VCGDGAGIHGALSAEYSGHLVALNIAFSLEIIDQKVRDERALPYSVARKKDQGIRPFLETMFRPPIDLLYEPNDTTIICRCEEVTAGEIRKTIKNGHHGVNQVKSLSRCGMGLCQGRQCDHAVTHIVAQELKKSIEDISFYRTRPPVKPITIEQLANLTVVQND
jgi:bacterioferritin-associated ferredoxin